MVFWMKKPVGGGGGLKTKIKVKNFLKIVFLIKKNLFEHGALKTITYYIFSESPGQILFYETTYNVCLFVFPFVCLFVDLRLKIKKKLN